jgi:hypothetical protein
MEPVAKRRRIGESSTPHTDIERTPVPTERMPVPTESPRQHSIPRFRCTLQRLGTLNDVLSIMSGTLLFEARKNGLVLQCTNDCGSVTIRVCFRADFFGEYEPHEGIMHFNVSTIHDCLTSMIKLNVTEITLEQQDACILVTGERQEEPITDTLYTIATQGDPEILADDPVDYTFNTELNSKSVWDSVGQMTDRFRIEVRNSCLRFQCLGNKNLCVPLRVSENIEYHGEFSKQTFAKLAKSHKLTPTLNIRLSHDEPLGLKYVDDLFMVEMWLACLVEL